MAGTGNGRITCGDASVVSASLSPGVLLLPLGAGLGYACGAIAVKRSLGAGVSGHWVNFFCNIALSLVFQIFWCFPGAPVKHLTFLAPVVCGILFFLGQIATFRAIASGDVSVATPLLGAKVILVALFSLFLIGQALAAAWWFASVLASVGIALISYSPGGQHRRLAVTVGWSLGAASLFALTDVLVQHWVPLVGYSRFAPIMFGTTGISSFIYLPALLKEWTHAQANSQKTSFSSKGMPWLLGGALLLALQAVSMYSAIGLYGSATLTNILYGSRCLWSVLLVWIFSSLAGEADSSANRSVVMGWRFAGALLLFCAMALVLH